MGQYDNLMEDSEGWLNSLVEQLSEQHDKQLVIDIASAHLKLTANGFARRIQQICKTFPANNCLLGKESATTACDDRKTTAQELLQLLRGGHCEAGLKNFTEFFKDELQICAYSRLCPQNLHVTVKIVRRKWRCSVAPNESLHSLMKCIGARSRNASQALFNARTLIKAFLGKHEQFDRKFTGNKNQVKILASIGRSLLDTCLNIGNDKDEEK